MAEATEELPLKFQLTYRVPCRDYSHLTRRGQFYYGKENRVTTRIHGLSFDWGIVVFPKGLGGAGYEELTLGLQLTKPRFPIERLLGRAFVFARYEGEKTGVMSLGDEAEWRDYLELPTYLKDVDLPPADPRKLGQALVAEFLLEIRAKELHPELLLPPAPHLRSCNLGLCPALLADVPSRPRIHPPCWQDTIGFPDEDERRFGERGGGVRGRGFLLAQPRQPRPRLRLLRLPRHLRESQGSQRRRLSLPPCFVN